MQDPQDGVVALVAAVLDGTPIDWDAALMTGTDATRPLVERLRFVSVAYPACQDEPVSAPPSPLAAGEHWGPLRLLARLGEGSSGEVWRAWDSSLEREVALKLLPLDGKMDLERRSVIHEGRLLARIRDPRVVTIHGAEERDGRIGLWMELVEGDDLELLLQTNGPLRPEEVARIGQDVSDALQAVHDAGVLHRDVKAQNVRRTPEGRIVLMDFGSGRDLEVSGRPANDLLGTPLYLAPEVFAGEPATRQSDVYSVGVLLFHLLTRQFPVNGRTVREIAEAHGAGTFTRLPTVPSGVPRALARVVERALAREPSKRFDRADALGNALRHADARRRKKRLAYVAMFGLTVVAVAWGIHAASRSPGAGAVGATPGSGIVQRQLHPPYSPGQLGAPSPDGRVLSYTDRRSGNLAILDVTTNTVRLLTSDGDITKPEYASVSTFSGDSRFIAYAWFSFACKCAELRKISVDGGTPQILWTYSGVDEVFPTSWSRDGRHVAAWVNPPGSTDYVLEIFDVDDKRRRTIGPGEAGLTSFSPDGGHVVFARTSSANPKVHDIYVADLEGRSEVLVSGPDDKSSPLWSADGHRVLFTSRGAGTASLWAQQVEGARAVGDATLISKNIGSVSPLGLTDTGSYYYMIEAQASDVLAARIHIADGKILEPPRRVTSSIGSSESPDWSPDGRFLAWRTVPQPFSLLVRNIVTAEERTLMSVRNVGPTPRWSRDGRSLLVRAGEGRERGLYVVDVQSGALRGPFLKNQPIGDYVWYRDGALLLDFERGVSALDFRTGKQTPVFSPPARWSLGRGLALSPDAKQLATNLTDGSHHVITVINLEGGETREILRLQLPDVILLSDWSRDGHSIIYVKGHTTDGRTIEPTRELWAVSDDGGAPQYLNIRMEGLQDVRMHPDGERIAFKSGGRRRELWVLENVLSGRH